MARLQQHPRLNCELATACSCSPYASRLPGPTRSINSYNGFRIQGGGRTSSIARLPRRGVMLHSFIESKVATSASPGIQSFQLQDRQSRSFHELPSGLRMEVIQHLATPKCNSERPPLVFLHGSYHAAWCWAVHWLPFFASHGHDCFALSFLGQGQSDTPASRVGGTLQTHARDVAHFIQHKVSRPPVLVGHSFGGLIVQQYLAHVAADTESSPSATSEGWDEPYSILSGAILACSVPPTGNGPLVQRYLMSKPIASIKVTLSFAAKLFAYNESLCKDTFFSANMPSSLVGVYQKLLASSSTVPLFNLRELNASLPVGRPAEHAPPILVIGAEKDFVVDLQGLHDTAAVYGNNLVVLPSMAHDIMLDVAWKDAAEAVQSWLDKNIGGSAAQ